MYIAKEDLMKVIKKEPKRVVKVSVLDDRCNVKLDTSPTTTFFASLKNAEGEKELTWLVDWLKKSGSTFILYNRRDGFKAYIENGKEVRRHDLRGNRAEVEEEKAEGLNVRVEAFNVADVIVGGGSEKFWMFEGIKMPINTTKYSESIARYVPKENNYIPDKGMVKKALVCLLNNQPLLFEGHTGSGKTELIKYLAHKTNNPLIVMQGSEDMETSTLLGHTEIDEKGTFWIDGLLPLAVKNGFWLYFDEINSCPAGVKIAIHNLLDDSRYLVLADNRGERIESHPNFRFVAACNPAEHGAYVGAGHENLAFLNRFSKIKIPYVEVKVEEKIMTSLYPHVELAIVKNLVKSANMIRDNFLNDRIMGTVSTRDLKVVCANLKYLSIDEALSIVIAKFTRDDAKNAVDCFEQCFGQLTECRKNFH